MKSMASALFGVLATVGGVPIIRALPGGPTQMISEQLSKVRPAAATVKYGHVHFCRSIPYTEYLVIMFSR